MNQNKSLLAKVKKTQREDTALVRHPLINAELAVRLRYLSCLSLVISIDNVIHPSEINYLQMMMRALKIPAESVQALLIQGADWNEAMISEEMMFIRSHDLGSVFVFDSALAALCDLQVCPSETQLMKIFSRWLQVSTPCKYLLKTLLEIPKVSRPNDYYRIHSDKFHLQKPVIKQSKCGHLRPMFKMICEDFARLSKSEKPLRS